MTVLLRHLAVVALAAVAAVSCARPQIPSGGPIPEVPLRVLETRPANLAVIEPFGGPIEIRFPRTVSENLTSGRPRDAVVVSPRSGEVAVQLSGDRVEISMEGGFRASTIYWITVLPRFQDRYQNPMDAPFDLFFSTGPTFEPNVLAGLLTDRLTLEGVMDGRVDARSLADSTVRTAISDSTGVFTFPYLPAGAYQVVAYEDNNRDWEPGFLEPQDSAAVAVSLGDTLIVTDLALLAPDTTAAVLNAVALFGSTALQLTFDDFLDPDDPLIGVEATVTPVDGDPMVVTEIAPLAAFEEEQAALAPSAIPDSATAAPDSAAVAPQGAADPAAPGAAVDPGPVPDGAPPTPAPPDAAAPVPVAQPGQDADRGEPLPAQDLVVVLEEAPVPGETYEVQIEGVRNINGVPGGGGSEELEVPEPPPPPAAVTPPDGQLPGGQPTDGQLPGTPNAAGGVPDSTAAPVVPGAGAPPAPGGPE